MNGNVKFFNRSKGFGFIAAEDGKEYFVHQTGVEEGLTLNDNDAVTFDVEDGDRGPKAVNVSLATESEEAAPAEEATEEPAAEEAELAESEEAEEKKEE